MENQESLTKINNQVGSETENKNPEALCSWHKHTHQFHESKNESGTIVIVQEPIQGS